MTDLQKAMIAAVTAMAREKARGNSHCIGYGLDPWLISYDDAIKIITEELTHEPVTRFTYS